MPLSLPRKIAFPGNGDRRWRRLVLPVLNDLPAGGHRIVTARRGTLQCVDGVLRPLPCFVALEVLGHVVEAREIPFPGNGD